MINSICSKLSGLDIIYLDFINEISLCFLFFSLTQVQIRARTIQIIKKKNTARVVPNAIAIITNTGDKVTMSFPSNIKEKKYI